MTSPRLAALAALFATAALASPRHDQFTLGVTGGAIFPADQAYDTTAPELGVIAGYDPEWERFRLDLSAFWTGGQSAERGVSAFGVWLASQAPTTVYVGGGVGLEWIGVNYALEGQTGWHVVDYPDTKPHAPFVGLTAGVEFARGSAHPWMLGVEAHLPFDYLAFDVRFPSLLGSVRIAL